MKKEKPTPSEIDGVQYRRTKTWRLALSQLNGGAGMCFYILVGYASYIANQGYGIATAAVGLILTATRIFDGVTDPLIAMLIEKTNTRFGKIRIWLLGGWAIESLAILILFRWASNGKHGTLMFVLLYMLYVIGYTMADVSARAIGPVITNDPKQRPMLGVWGVIYNYLTPMILSVYINMVILRQYNNEYSIAMLGYTCVIVIAAAFVLFLLGCVGISEADKPENFTGVSLADEKRKVKFQDMWSLLKNNRPLQCYIVSAASDKLAQQTSSQTIISTMMFGILMGNMGLGTTLSAIGILPSIVFAIIGARYAGKYGNKESIVTWTGICIIITIVMALFYGFIDMRSITTSIIPMALFIILTFSSNGAKMCVTTATGAMMSDIVDYEMDRSGKFMPAAVSATYSFVDKIISAFGVTIATSSVAMIGYTTTMPQPTDEPSAAIKILTISILCGLPILGWICTLIAMRFCELSKAGMIEVQKRIAEKKTQQYESSES